MREKVGKGILLVGLALSVAFILWFTLFSRVGSESRHFYPPFWSYKAIANGSGEALLEVLGNILLFIPIGVIASMVLHLTLWQSITFGLAASFVIESCQWLFWLGSFEIDDLFHNTIGTIVGIVLAEKIPFFREKKINALLIISLAAVFLLLGFAYQGMRVQTMKKYAAMNDRDDGTKNLLVLSPEPKYIGKTKFTVSYISDGSVRIKGQADNRAWIEIGKITLPAGEYSFAGLSGVEENTVTIELEYFSKEQRQYIRLTEDIGPIDQAFFELSESTKLRALIGVYSGAEGEYLIRPVLYREE